MANGTFVFDYFSGVLGSTFNTSSNSSLAFKKLTGTSFNLSEKTRYSYRSVLSGIKELLAIPVQETALDIKDRSIIYDVAENTATIREDYLNFYNINEQFYFISAKDLSFFNSGIDKLFFLFCTVPVQLHLVIYGLFKKDRSGLNSVLKNILITRNFSALKKKVEKKKVYLFSIYDTNSAFLANNLIKQGFYVSQITSEVPLYKWNKIIITNELIICSEYQTAEVEEFKNTIRFNELKLFGPELFYKISDQYKSSPDKNFNIGFYSTGGWIRNKLGHIDQGTSIEEFETRILNDLNTILSNKKEINLIIYPHPREREFFNNSESELYNYYKKALPSITFKINQVNKPANMLFDDVYLAVCYMTTLIFERVHAKRKSVIAYFKEEDFPLNNNIENLSVVKDINELQRTIEMTY